MPRYAPKARVRCDWFDDDRPLLPYIEVGGSDAVETGLVTANGDMIMRLPNPIGFGRDEEW